MGRRGGAVVVIRKEKVGRDRRRMKRRERIRSQAL
jgi:hypothetical protein